VFAIGAHYLSPEKLSLQRHSGSARWASKHIIGKGKPAKVISMVRSPIENMLSTYAREYYGQQDYGPLALEQAALAGQATADELSQEFLQTYLQSNNYLHPLRWFETEFQPALGIDVYQHPFDQQRRFAQFREKSCDVLILGTEMKDQQKSKLIADFVGIPQLRISNATVASQTTASSKKNRLPPGRPGKQTPYAEKYKRLKQHVVIPDRYLETIVDSRYMQHFFSEREREAVRLKYSGKVGRGE